MKYSIIFLISALLTANIATAENNDTFLSQEEKQAKGVGLITKFAIVTATIPFTKGGHGVVSIIGYASLLIGLLNQDKNNTMSKSVQNITITTALGTLLLSWLGPKKTVQIPILNEQGTPKSKAFISPGTLRCAGIMATGAIIGVVANYVGDCVERKILKDFENKRRQETETN